MQVNNVEASYQKRMFLRCYQRAISPIASNNDKGRKETVRRRGKRLAAEETICKTNGHGLRLLIGYSAI